MKAVIFGGAEIGDYEWLDRIDFSDNLIICADGGYRHTIELNLKPNIIIGDNDSWQCKYPSEVESIICPAEKDYTDMERCVNYAIENGCNEIDVFGALGGRLDHEYANFCLLSYGIKREVKIRLLDKKNEVFMENKSFILKKNDKKYVSFFPYGGDVKNFSIKGLKYEALNMELRCDEVRASSNEFSDVQKAEITFDNGCVLVMLCDE